MAYTDIKNWASILEKQEQENVAFDEACAKRCAAAKALDEKEFDECDTEVIGIGSENVDEDDDIQDVKELDEDSIDFSCYGVCEADDREVLTKVSSELGRPASTANLVKQDAVQLNETDRLNEMTSNLNVTCKNVADLAKYFKDAVTEVPNNEIKVLIAIDGFHYRQAATIDSYTDHKLYFVAKNEDKAPPAHEINGTPLMDMIGDLQNLGVKKMSDIKEIFCVLPKEDNTPELLVFKCCSFFSADKYNNPPSFIFSFKAPSQDITNGFFDESEDDKADEEVINEADDKIETLKKNDDIPMTDKDWEECDALKTTEEKIAFIKAKCDGIELSPSAQEELDATLELVRNMGELNAKYDDMDAAFKRAKYLQHLTITRDLTDNEMKEFANCLSKLDDDHKNVLLSIRNSGPLRTRVFLNPNDIKFYNNPNYSSGTQKGDSDSDDEDNTGDETREMRKSSNFFLQHPELEYIPEPMQPGHYDRLFGDVPGYVGAIDRRREKRAEIAKAANTAKQILPKLNALLRYYDAQEAIKSKSFRDAWRDPEGSTLGKTWDTIVKGIETTTDINALKNELKASVANDPDSRAVQMMIEYMFNGLNLTNQMRGAIKGAARNQSGSTGMMTQRGDTAVYALLIMMANYLGIAQDEAAELFEKMRRQAPSEADKAAGIEPRSRCKVLAQIILTEVLDEITSGKNTVQVPSPAEDKKKFTNLVGLALVLVWRDATPAERSEMQRWYKEDFEGKHEVRKHMSHLTVAQNEEFQQIIQNLRGDFDSLTPEQKIRVLQLDIMRKSAGNETNPAIEEQAGNKARRAYEYAQRHNSVATFDKKVQDAIEVFLTGIRKGNK